MNNIIHLENLSVSYLNKGTEQLVINHVSLDVKIGETITIIGETGSGKSTLAKALIGLQPNVHKCNADNYQITLQNEGQILMDFDKPKSFQEIRGKIIGLVFQEAKAHLNPIMICGKQLMESLLLRNIKASKDEVYMALKEIGFEDAERIFKAYPHQLSGGECQRVLLVMAVLQKPSILILDEPTSSLDKPNEKLVLSYLHRLQQEHQTAIIFITHDLFVAQEISDRVFVLEKGNVVDTFEPKQPKILSKYSQGLFDNWKVLNESLYPVENIANKTVLEVDNISIEYNISNRGSLLFNKKKTAVNSVSFSLFHGDTLAIFGYSGSGKTSLANAICGLLKPTTGKIETDQKISMVFQNPDLSLDPLQKVGNALREVVSKHEQTDLEEKTHKLFELVRLPLDYYHKKPHELSGGEKQRVCIARAIASTAKIIIFDEATASLDPSVKLEMLQLLKSLKDKLGLTYIFITHELAVIKFVTNKLIILDNGSIVEEGKTTSIVKNPTNPVTKALILQSDV